VNKDGRPVCFLLSGGQREDSTMAVDLLSEFSIAGSNILGDKAYGARKILEYISEQGGTYTIPPRKNLHKPWKYDLEIYKNRNIIERFFNRIKAFRRVATRYDKLASSFYAFVFISSIFILSI